MKLNDADVANGLNPGYCGCCNSRHCTPQHTSVVMYSIVVYSIV
jgi:hypothetical protein